MESCKTRRKCNAFVRQLAARLALFALLCGVPMAVEVGRSAPANAQAEPACETNDDFACRSPIGLDESVVGSNAAGTSEVARGEISPCGGDAATVWWSFTADDDAPVTVDTLGSDFDTTLAVFEALPELDGVPGAEALVACNDDDASLQSVVRFDASAGTEYLVQVGGFGASVGDIALTVSGRGAFQFDAATVCVDQLGVVTFSVVNPTRRDVELSISLSSAGVEQVSRQISVPPGETGKTVITGRRDGRYSYSLFEPRTVDVGGGLLTIECVANPPGPAVLATVECSGGSGVLWFSLIAGAGPSSFALQVGSINKDRFVDGNAERAVAISGRPDGRYDYAVSDDTGFATTGTAVVACARPPAEAAAALSTSCAGTGARAGIISAELTAGAASAQFVLRVPGLGDRALRVEPGEIGALSRTGRSDGTYEVVVLADAVPIATETLEVRCRPPGPDILADVTCAGDRGTVAVELVADPASSTRFEVSISGFERRDFEIVAGSRTSYRRSGRPNGHYTILAVFESVDSGVTGFFDSAVDVTCDPTQTCAVDGVVQVVTIRPAECEALVAIAAQSPQLRDLGWDGPTDPCQWFGVVCERDRVTGLSLAQIGLAALPPDIGAFQSLEFLVLGDNALRSVPAQIALLGELDYLDLRNNALASVPDLSPLTRLGFVGLCGQRQPVALDPATQLLLDSLPGADYELLSCEFPLGEASVRTSCIDGRGAITATFENADGEAALASFGVSGLDPVDVMIPAGAGETVTRTGRPNGVYIVTIDVNGHEVLSTVAEVECPSVGIDSGPVFDGEALFNANCAVCHGVDGGGGIGVSLVDSSLPKQDVIIFIEDPGAGSLMPAFEGELSAGEIDAIAEYVIEAFPFGA